MSALPPPPLRGWQGIPLVWQQWFLGLFSRVGGTNGRVVVIDDDGTDASALDELEARVMAAIPERPDVAALEARIADLETEAASLTVTNAAALEARIAALEVEVASLTVTSRAEILQRIDDLEREIV